MKNLLLLLLFSVVFSACTPLRVVRVSPERETDIVRYDYGAAVLEARTTVADVSVSYYDATAQYLVFHLAVTNQSDMEMLFDPVNVTLTTETASLTPAIDPELYLLEHDLADIRNQRKARALSWIGAGLMVASTATVLLDVPIAEGGNSLLTQEILSVSSDVALLALSESQNSRRQGYLPPPEVPTPEQRAFWVDHTLRITTIAPGETAVGKIVFDRQDLARNLRLTVPLPVGEVGFDFVQVSMDGQ